VSGSSASTPVAAAAAAAQQERYYTASHWRLVRAKFGRHLLARAALAVLGVIYVGGLCAGFLAPYGTRTVAAEFAYAPPQRLRFVHEGRIQVRPFVYGYERHFNDATWEWEYLPDPAQKLDLRFFVAGEAYRFWGLIETRLHLFGVPEPAQVFLFGTDKLGRDLFSRNLHAIRVSLTVGLLGVAFSFVIGCLLGGISGYYGGPIDTAIQRVIEFLIALPTIPLWMGLSAALPLDWPALRIYFFITIILSTVGWTRLGRVVRGKLLELREQDFTMAARVAGARDLAIITRHLLPSFMSYLIVDLTLAIPYMILGETALSFLGLGLRPPVVSWGVLLHEAQNVQTVALHPWLLIPGVFVIVSVLAFNFVGDGLRDAADPYK
jgi:peptide/nickel transport system permease protein